MRYLIKLIAIVMIMSSLVACTKSSPNVSGGNANKLTGDIYDANGNKFNIPNSSVTIHVTSTNATGDSYAIEMDGNSHYEQKVTSGNYTYDVLASVLVNGNRVNVPLEPLDGESAGTEFDSSPGVTRDFKLSLTGLIPGGDPADVHSYYGGHVSVVDGAANFTTNGLWNNLATKYPGYTVNFRFTGSSNCVDGSVSPILDIPTSVENLQGVGTYLVNIPLAKYFLTALLRSPTGQQSPLKLNFVAGAYGNHYNFLDFSFAPSPTDPDKRPSMMYVAVWEN